jgi:hypothetical protein
MLPPAFGYFPSGSQWYGNPMQFLLPYVEQQALYTQSTTPNPPSGPSAVSWDSPNDEFSYPIKTYICPSDPSVSDQGNVPEDPGHKPAGASSYASNALTFGQCVVTSQNPLTVTLQQPVSQAGSPPASIYYAKIPAGMPDGLSNTIL